MKLKALESLARWNARRRGVCPGCGSKGAACHTCKICYGWAAKSRNYGKVPTPDLLQNWSRRHEAAKN